MVMVLSVFLLFAVLVPLGVQCQESVVLLCRDSRSEDSGGAPLWTQTEQVRQADTTLGQKPTTPENASVAQLDGTGNYSAVLLGNNFNFDEVPPGAQITGLQVDLVVACYQGSCCTQWIEVLIDGVLPSDTAEFVVENCDGPWGDTWQRITFGGAEDLWGLAIEQRSAATAVALVIGSLNDTDTEAFVDSISLQVFYELPTTTTSATLEGTTADVTTTSLSTDANSSTDTSIEFTSTLEGTTSVQPTLQTSQTETVQGTTTTVSTTTTDEGTTSGANAESTDDTPDNSVIYILAVMIPIILIAFCALLFVVIAFRKRLFNSKLSDKESFRHSEDATELVSIPEFKPVQFPPVNEEDLVVPITKLSEHIEKLLKPVGEERDDVNGFSAEFNYVEQKTEHHATTTDFGDALKSTNSQKNRYMNVLPPNATRVLLQGTKEEEGSDYINANFIKGLIPGSDKAYIATQGPLQSITDDFWRMIWETNSCVILMLTKEIENGRLKCDRYWPTSEEKPLSSDSFKVSLLESREEEELAVRKLRLEHLTEHTSREVVQFQYIEWPDHGVPVSTEAFLDLAKAADGANSTKGPILVHCSAGIGRTGTFCTIHSILKKVELELNEEPKKEPLINIAQVVIGLREQRSNMVQTVEQYEFCYQAIRDGSKPFIKDWKGKKKTKQATPQ